MNNSPNYKKLHNVLLLEGENKGFSSSYPAYIQFPKVNHFSDVQRYTSRQLLMYVYEYKYTYRKICMECL